MTKNLLIKLLKKKIIIYDIFTIILAGVIVFFWFNKGNLIAGAETGIPFYNLERTSYIASYPYVDSQLGVANPFYIHFFPIWKALQTFSFIGLPTYLIQAILFLFLLIIPLMAIPRLSRELFGEAHFFTGVVAGIFYVFNLFTVSQVWIRFLYSIIFLWSLLPLFLLLWIRWLREKNIKSLIMFCLFSILFAGAFAIPTGIFALWFTLFLFSVVTLLRSSAKSKIISLSLFGFIGWLVLSLWWIMPMAQQRNNIYSLNLSSNSNIESLVEVSRYFQNNDIFFLRQRYYFGNNSVLSSTGNSTFSNSVSIFVFLFLLISLADLRKFRNFYPFIILFFVGWFISKGSNPPFGYEFYKLIYSKIPLSQIFRNPYEKFGVVYLLGYSILFAFGLIKFSKFFGRYKSFIVCLFLLLDIYSLSSIYFTDKYFPGTKRVEVPNDYLEINKAINGNQRILQLPFLFHPSLEFTWGFEGEEPSMHLFDNPSVSSPVSMKSIDEFYINIGKMLLNGHGNNVLGITNVKYLVLHRDRGFGIGAGLEEYQKILSANHKISFVGTFGNLDLYENNGALVNYVYPINNLIFVNGFENLNRVVSSSGFDYLKSAVLDINENDNSFKEPDLNLAKGLPQLTFSKISPVEYSVSVNNTDGNFVLVLANNFNPLWSAESNKIIFNEHFKVNGFANAWLIDKIGEYKINLRFNGSPF